MSTSLNAIMGDDELKERVDLHLYPFGNAQVQDIKDVSEGYQYWHADQIQSGFQYVIACQHGEDECFGNTVQACALELLDNETSASFILCMDSKDGVSQEWASHDCAHDLNIELDPIRDCTQGPDGNLALAKLGEATSEVKDRQYVPWVLLNGKHSGDAEQDGDEGNKGHFLQEVCALLEDPQPKACSGNSVVTVKSALYSNAGAQSAFYSKSGTTGSANVPFGCRPNADQVTQ